MLEAMTTTMTIARLHRVYRIECMQKKHWSLGLLWLAQGTVQGGSFSLAAFGWNDPKAT